MRKFIERYTQSTLMGSNRAWWSERLCLKARLWAVSRAMRARAFLSTQVLWLNGRPYICEAET